MTKSIYGRVFKKRFKKAKLTRCMHSMHLTKLNLNPLFQYLLYAFVLYLENNSQNSKYFTNAACTFDVL